VRQAVAGALAVLADPTSGPALLPLLNDESSDVVTEAARALGRIGNPSSATFLAATLAKPGQPLLARRALAAALAHAGHPDAQPQLLAALEDEDPQVRAYAADALGHIGTEQALPALAALKADKNRLIRGVVSDRATRAIELLERRGRREGKTAEGS
jgi:HEAT repeat protein